MARDVYGYLKFTSHTQVKAGPGVVHAIVLTGGSDQATATVYDELSGSGDILVSVKAAANTTVNVILDVAFGVGLYVQMGGTAPVCVVAFR